MAVTTAEPLEDVPATAVSDITLPNTRILSSVFRSVALAFIGVPSNTKLPVITKLLLMVVVPVAAPMLTVVAPPKAFTVVGVDIFWQGRRGQNHDQRQLCNRSGVAGSQDSGDRL